tara:strand:- start:6302 stop:6520 length:219 start_codon:yes stop_codon:yes gene_type:complete
MFEAMVLVCMMGNLQDCFVADDTRGPYREITECIERTTEMAAQIITMYEDHIVMGVRCDPTGDEPEPEGLET